MSPWYEIWHAQRKKTNKLRGCLFNTLRLNITNSCGSLLTRQDEQQTCKFYLITLVNKQLECLDNIDHDIYLIYAKDINSFLKLFQIDETLIHPVVELLSMIVAEVVRHYYGQFTHFYLIIMISQDLYWFAAFLYD